MRDQFKKRKMTARERLYHARKVLKKFTRRIAAIRAIEVDVQDDLYTNIAKQQGVDKASVKATLLAQRYGYKGKPIAVRRP